MNQMFAKNKKLIFVCLIAFILSCLMYHFGFFASVQEKIYDKLFVQTTPTQRIVIIGIDDVTLNVIGPWPLKRQLYGDILNYLVDAKSVGFDMFFAEASRYGKKDDDSFARSLQLFTKPVFIPIELRDRGGVAVPFYSEYEEVDNKHIATSSFANILVDNDGIVRQFEFQRDGRVSFACAVSLMPCTRTESTRIQYVGKERTITTVSFLDVVGGKVPTSFFKDAYVLVGVTSPSLHDVSGTPFGQLPGVEIHANILHTILANNYFIDTPPTFVYLLFLLIHLAILYIILNHKTFTKITVLLGLLFVVVQLLSITLFGKHILLPQLYTTTAFIFATVSIFTMQYILEGKEKRFIEQTFKYYLMPDVIEDLKNNPHKLKLGGENREVTILFSDIRGFTTISEKLSAEELTKVINEYLTAMTDIIMEEGGLVDKYIGDAIMAFWGAPVENTKQAECAVRAVIKMSEKLKQMNIEWTRRGVPELGIGIGLNKGQVIVGNMGSEKRFNYTIMGDEVNFGSRLEGLNKKYGSECIVSESVAESVKDNPDFILRKLDRVLVKGKKEPKNIYEVITDNQDDSIKKSVKVFEEAFELYSRGDFGKALELFKESFSVWNNTPAKVFIERVQELKLGPVNDWNGVYEHTSK